MADANEKSLRQQIISAFDRATLMSFYQLRPGRVLWTFGHIWLGLSAALALGVWAWLADEWWPKLLMPLLVVSCLSGCFSKALGVVCLAVLFTSPTTTD